MNLKNHSRKLTMLLLALTLTLPIVIAPTILGFMYGQSSGGADYAIFEGVAGNDYYDSMQYSYQINQWASEYKGLYGEYTLSPEDDWFDAGKSLRVGVTEYGEFCTPDHAGIAYGADSDEWSDTESWASEYILAKYWIQGWVLFINYTRQGILRCIEGWAIYSDLTTAEAGRKVYSWYGDYMPSEDEAVLTEGTLIPGGIKILYDSARLVVARTEVVIHDGYYDEDVAKVVITIILNKDTKYAIVYKDVKMLLDPKVIDLITDFCFSERYELDMARGVNPGNEAFVHFFENFDTTVYQHPVTGGTQFDVLQAFDPLETYLFFAGFWPNVTEYTLYNPLVPNVPLDYLRILDWGTAVPDIPSPPTGPGEASTPWVITQWRYNSTMWPNVLQFLAKSAYRQIRFVEVFGMTDFTDNPHPAMDVDAGYTYNQVDTEVQYLLNKVFNPEDLTTLSPDMYPVQPPFMWTGLGQSAATTDSAGAGFVAGNQYDWFRSSFMLFDRNDTMFPWIAPVVGMKGTIPYGLNEFGGDYYETFSNSGKGTGTDTTLYKRTALKDFAFGVYDDVIEEGPEPIAGGWSNYSAVDDGWYWYPSKDPLTERWWYDGEDWYDAMYEPIDYSPNGIQSIGGMKANSLTRYFNDFCFAIGREGTNVRALIDSGTVVGSAPTSDFAKTTIDYFPISSWDTSKDTHGYKEGYAVIALARDINGTRGLVVYGWDGRDTFWATAWASQYIMGATDGWIPAGTVALILEIDYTSGDREPTGFTVVKALGTITEFGDNYFDETFDFDSGVEWTGYIEIPEYPWDYEGDYIWWWAKLPTYSTAHIQFDP